MDRLTTTIKREYLAEIVAGTKKVEYRDIKPYWTERFAKLTAPFELRLINGMGQRVPEVTVVISRVTEEKAAGRYALRIAKILNVKNWNRRTQRPTSRT